MKTNAPGAVSSLVCGIISVVLSWVPLLAIAALVLGIIAIVTSRKAENVGVLED